MSTMTPKTSKTPRLPATLPVAPEIAPQLVNFAPVKKSFVLHNAKPKRVEVMFNSNMMTLPAVHEVHPLRHALDADGDPIPGSYVVEDIYSYDPNQQSEVLTMDAERAVKTILNIVRRPDGHGAEATSMHAISGVSLLPLRAPKEVWQEASRVGEHRAFLASVQQAEYELAAFDMKNATRKQSGLPPDLPGHVQLHAAEIVRQYRALAKEDSDAALAPYREQEAQESAAEDLKFEIYMKARVMKLAEEAAEEMNLDKKKLFDRMMKDPEVRKHAQKEFRMRRKGHMPIADEDLDAAAEMGTDIDEAGLE